MRYIEFPGGTHFSSARFPSRGKQLRWDSLGIMGEEERVGNGAASPGGAGRKGGGGGGRAEPGERKKFGG